MPLPPHGDLGESLNCPARHAKLAGWWIAAAGEQMTDGKRVDRSRHMDDCGARADEALEAARNMPPGPERNDALKKAGELRNAADVDGPVFARRGRPPR